MKTAKKQKKETISGKSGGDCSSSAGRVCRHVGVVIMYIRLQQYNRVIFPQYGDQRHGCIPKDCGSGEGDDCVRNPGL